SVADGQEYSVSGFVNVIKNYKVDVDVDQANSVCKGETARYNVEVTNDGIQSDQIALSTEFGELSENRVTLDAGESTEVTVTASSEEALDRNFNIKASSTSVSYATDTESAAFTSETCYQSSMSVSPETSETSAFNEAEFDITVQNNGTKTDEFSLSADRGELSTSNLEVEPGSTETATLTFTPEELGDHQIDIEASGRSTTTNTVTVEASNGMESEVSFDEAKTVCSHDTR
ncbi:hypothetical protein HRED_10427, partial [Candidatus Haloredivivus sp. G17]